jgi:hypothetical protein
MVPAGKHRDDPGAAAERYGKHSRAHARGLSVLALLRRVVAQGGAVRLAWRDSETNAVVDDRQEFPTAVLPAFRDEGEHGDADESTEPATVTREARRWFGPDGMVRWPLAG